MFSHSIVPMCFVLVGISCALFGCHSKQPDPVLSQAQGQWMLAMSSNTPASLSIQYGWSWTQTQDPKKFGKTAQGFVQKGFEWIGMGGGSAVGMVVGSLANDIVDKIGDDDWSSREVSESQTYTVQVDPTLGFFVWVWNFHLSGSNDFKAGLKTTNFMVTQENKPPVCMPGCFTKMRDPYGACKKPDHPSPTPSPSPSTIVRFTYYDGGVCDHNSKLETGDYKLGECVQGQRVPTCGDGKGLDLYTYTNNDCQGSYTLQKLTIGECIMPSLGRSEQITCFINNTADARTDMVHPSDRAAAVSMKSYNTTFV